MSETKLDIAKLRELEAKAASIGPSTIVVKCVNGVHYSFVHGGDYDSLSPEENGRIFAFASGLLANAPSLLAAAEERDRLRAALSALLPRVPCERWCASRVQSERSECNCKGEADALSGKAAR